MIYFMAGLPRSGSTLLSAYLNSVIPVTPTNGLSQLIFDIREKWTANTNFQAQGYSSVVPKLKEGIKGFISSFHGGKTVIDKSRTWIKCYELLLDLYGSDLKIIFPMRDLKEIVASFERLRLQNPWTHQFSGNTIFERAKNLLEPDGMIGSILGKLNECRYGIIPVHYREILSDPKAAAYNVLKKMNIPFDDITYCNNYDFSKDLDTFGVTLHELQPEARRSPPWQSVLPLEIGEFIDQYGVI